MLDLNIPCILYPGVKSKYPLYPGVRSKYPLYPGDRSKYPLYPGVRSKYPCLVKCPSISSTMESLSPNLGVFYLLEINRDNLKTYFENRVN